MDILLAEHLSKSYTRVKTKKATSKFKKPIKFKEEFLAVDDISLSVKKGEIVGILGPNGAGKTTLLRMLGGIIVPQTGTIQIGDLNYQDHKYLIKEKIGYLSGNTKLYVRFTPYELLSNFGSIFGIPKDVLEAKIETISQMLEMTEFLHSRIEHLSTGQTQRTNIARCLIHSPSLYILDEPTLGLDVVSSKNIIDFMLNEKTNGNSVLYSTHYMEEAEYICDRIIMLHRGKILAQGDVNQLKTEYNVRNLRELFFLIADIKEEES